MKTNTNTIAKSITMGSVAAFAFLGMVSASLANAATYLYVTSTGELNTVEADTASMAIMTAPNIAYNSGVIEVDEYNELAENDATVNGNTSANNNDEEDYAYVDAEGDVEYVEADSDSEALAESDNDAAYNSGVLDTEEFDDSENLE